MKKSFFLFLLGVIVCKDAYTQGSAASKSEINPYSYTIQKKYRGQKRGGRVSSRAGE